ncbi:MAG: nuclease A inhibitor family protein [Leptolyngbyaceae cyanobacterium bins.59]|nr:nuclease A inhibitor family protein [Leptolyngbyaceae cyanobacterium bins.59]
MSDLTLEFINRLQTLTEGLLWMSEIDASFSTIHWDAPLQNELTPEKVLELTGQGPETPVEVVEVDNFFAAATEEQEWFGPEEQETATRYRELVLALKQNLDHLTVYRMGEVRLNVYIVGYLAESWVGLATQVVET